MWNFELSARQVCSFAQVHMKILVVLLFLDRVWSVWEMTWIQVDLCALFIYFLKNGFPMSLFFRVARSSANCFLSTFKEKGCSKTSFCTRWVIWCVLKVLIQNAMVQSSFQITKQLNVCKLPSDIFSYFVNIYGFQLLAHMLMKLFNTLFFGILYVLYPYLGPGDKHVLVS